MTKLPAGIARNLAVLAGCDPRTIQRVWLKQSVKGMSGERALQVVSAHRMWLSLTPHEQLKHEKMIVWEGSKPVWMQ